MARDKPKHAIHREGETGGVLVRSIAAFKDIVAGLPTPWRAACALAIIGILGLIGYARWGHEPSSPASPVSPAPPTAPPIIDQATLKPGEYGGGVFDPKQSVVNEQNQETSHKAAEDREAANYHINHDREDHPEEVEIATGDPKHLLFYKYYAKTDRCMFVRRVEPGYDLTQWIRDPSYHEHDVDKKSDAAPRAQSFDLGGRVFAVASAQTLARPPVVAAAQANTCLNPHPGQFRYWWGQPIDQCNSPMYRQFTDGCMHYQVYNRCANAWDSRIFWTVCVPNHQW